MTKLCAIKELFWAFGYKIKLVEQKRIPGKYADINFSKRLIRVTQEGMKPEILLHELGHLVLLMTGKKEFNEKWCDAFSSALS